MSRSAVDTLLHPFRKGLLAAPRPEERVLVLNAPADFPAPGRFDGDLTLVQDFRPVHLALSRAGHPVAAEAAGEAYDFALVHLGRHRAANEAMIAEAAARMRTGGLLVAAGGKSEGAASLARRLRPLAKDFGQVPKYHGVAFWFTVGDDARSLFAGGHAAAAAEPALREGMQAAPGMFSHERRDPGSAFLLANLPRDVAGAVADFGAGWGYLAAGLARGFPGVTRLDLYEASHAALCAARANLAGADMPVGYFWHDLRTEPVARDYDCVVMNPPFHEGRAAEPAIGADFIRTAAGALKRGGRLFMVANRGLPYEKVLAEEYAESGEMARDGRYKVLWARR